MGVADRLAALRADIARACADASRAPDSVQLVAVSKKHSVQAIREAYAAGQRDFGENYAQELRAKAQALADLLDLRWHFIGRLQTNKAKYVAPVSYRVHAIDALKQGEALASRATSPVSCLVAVHSGDPSKGGVDPEEALDLCRGLHSTPGVRLRGLMTLPPWTEDPADAAPFFAHLGSLATEGRAQGLPLDELSMGMTHDYRTAIAHGATWVRIGTAIFGPREETPG